MKKPLCTVCGRRPAIPGSDKCKYHGGARRRAAVLLAEDAVEVICSYCGQRYLVGVYGSGVARCHPQGMFSRWPRRVL